MDIFAEITEENAALAEHLRKAMELLGKISELHYVALHSNAPEVAALSGDLMHKVRTLELEIKEVRSDIVKKPDPPAEPKKDNINHPSHYETQGIECIQAMEITQGTVAVENFCLCNAFKYLWRHDRKGGAEDIKKAIWYLNKYVELEGKQE